MGGFSIFEDDSDGRQNLDSLLGLYNTRDKTIQIAVPRWTALYAARKQQKNEATVLPELPDSLFGWLLPVWRITDQQLLASAGMDAYAFLAFFKMAIKFLTVTLFFSLIVIKPVHDANPDNEDLKHPNKTHHHNSSQRHGLYAKAPTLLPTNGTIPYIPEYMETDYLWIYVVFAYLFSAIAVYLIVTETKKIIEVRQEYLGTQTSITDRTIRLSGIPTELQSEEKIKDFIEALDIGKVESVTLCRNWKMLDTAMDARMTALRKLEEAYTVHLGRQRVERNLVPLPISQQTPPGPRTSDVPDNEDGESAALMGANGDTHPSPSERARPKTKIRYGFMGFRTRQVDAIDYYEERLRQTDERVKELRRKSFIPVPLAFVTMDSVAACQMATQAVLDPSPRQLIANQSPAPADVIWPNTYLPRRGRMIRSWSITVLIVLLTIFWSIIFVPIAGSLNTKAISKVFPQLANLLEENPNLRSLVNTQLPTLVLSLLIVLVPYLYYWLSWYQGMMSQGDIELSTISKNFFFTFFNFFLIFTVLGAASEFFRFFERFGDALRDWQKVAYTVALSLQRLLNFYVNFIILQGLGLFPFRLLQVGSVSLYPVWRVGAKTPRDYAELMQPAVFSYGFYLPNALLIFIICMVYSVLRSSWQVLLAGLIYFAFGHFVYKYQLLYAMDHRQQATGHAWVMICDRVFVGLLFFQFATAGQLLLKQAIPRAVLIIPLIIATIWMNIVYGRTYKPLMKFIALRSVRRGEQYTDREASPDAPEANSTSSSVDLVAPERSAWAGEGSTSQLRYFRENRVGVHQPAVVESGETGLRFINPSLITPLGSVWIDDKNFRREGGERGSNGDVIGEENV
ncbi:hypothetical protein LTR37_014933 [Vermiconidia calcicola]|uniref:Uncharacterized protein n=1 Tax=Vermiconidia calcicola TaxID=1690605 RepID=A0ACC3MS82_9PEZI|nr:hypothetical protein LTR37_014933 [Vermiconidia calcicola]